jgi:hypothetical protein
LYRDGVLIFTLASTPAAISGRNMVWREMVSQAIRDDPGWEERQLSRGLAAKKLDQCVVGVELLAGHTVIGNHDGISRTASSRHESYPRELRPVPGCARRN